MSGWEEFEEAVRRSAPDVLGVTAHTCEAVPSLECLRRARAVRPGLRTVAGGIHPSMFPAEYLGSGLVDHVLKGEGEVSFPRLCEDPSRFAAESWGETPVLDELPYEDRELWPDFARRLKVPWWGKHLPTPIMDFLAQRGCPWQCAFCCGPGEQNLYTKPKKGDETRRLPAVRSRSPDHVLGEMVELHGRYPYRGVIFHDDQFLLNPEWVDRFCAAMERHGMAQRGIKFWAAIRADMVCRYPDRLRHLKEVGLHILSIGFESFSDRMLRWMKKGTTCEINLQAAETCRKLGIQIYANVILGTPYSDGKWYPEDDLASLWALERVNPEIRSVSFFSPIPGSPFYEWYERAGLMVLDGETDGQRYPDRAKMKGVDYDFLNRMRGSPTSMEWGIRPDLWSLPHRRAKGLLREGHSAEGRKALRTAMRSAVSDLGGDFWRLRRSLKTYLRSLLP